MDWEQLWADHSETIIAWAEKLVGVVVVLFIGWLLAGWVSRLIRRGLEQRFDAMLVRFFANLARYAVLTFTVLGCLGLFGVETTSFAAVIAAAGLAIGLAFQGTLSNFASGVMLLVFRPFKVGDFVKVADELGTVEEVELFTTELKTPDARRIIIPNSSVFGNKIQNMSHHPERRVDISVGTDYGADVDQTRTILETMAPKIEGVISEPEPQIFLAGLGASSIDWVVRVWCKAEDYWDVHQRTIRDAKKALDDAGIGIPFPQRDVHLDESVVQALAKR